MNIKILDSWLREYIKTNATPKQIAEKLSLSSVSVERIEKYGNDFIYDVEVTTNRPDLMSINGLARETATVLKENGINANFIPLKTTSPKPGKEAKIEIINNPKLVNRVLAVIMDVTVKPSPKAIAQRLESTGIRSLNNLIDVTNYVMRVTGHPTHVFDFDRLNTKTLKIREAKPNEEIITLDKKLYKLQGGEIVAEDDKGRIIDLLSVMGLENSVVTDQTKRILFFIDNCDPTRIRKTSMSLGIRTEAAVINEKEIDPELALTAMNYGIELFTQIAEGKVVSEITDIYPNKIKTKSVAVSLAKIHQVIGVPISLTKAENILTNLDFKVEKSGDKLIATPPTFRANEIAIPEDIIEEIARIYGYHNIPNSLPVFLTSTITNLEHNEFFWENRIKDALKYWGFTESYTYPMVAKDIFAGKIEDAVTIQNPLSEDMVYMRKTLIPSLLQVAQKNKNHEQLKLFELANIYEKRANDLPDERLKLAGIMKNTSTNFYAVKGILEQLMTDLGIEQLTFKTRDKGAAIFVAKDLLGEIKIISKELIAFELEFKVILKYATLRKTYKPLSKYPPVVEDLAIVASKHVLTGDLMQEIKNQSDLIWEVTLLDKYEDTRTFHVVYQSYQKNLTSEDITPIRIKILNTLKEKYHAKLKE